MGPAKRIHALNCRHMGVRVIVVRIIVPFIDALVSQTQRRDKSVSPAALLGEWQVEPLLAVVLPEQARCK
jgi:hypothetical protein